MPDIAQLSVRVTADTKAAEQGIDNVDKQVHKASGWKGILGNALSFAGGVAALSLASAGVSFLTSNLGDMVQSGMDANREMDILAQGLRSTHDASGMTVQGLDDLSTKILNLTGIDDDSTKAAEQMLLTFTGIGKQAFPAATQAAADMATRMNGGAIPSAQQMQQQALLLGKALNDPVKGMTALTREGVTFTDEQKKQITAMEKAGNTAGAQKIILGELNKEFGGSAKAAGEANGGIAILTAQFDNMKQTVGQALVPIFVSLMQTLTPIITSLGNALPGAIRTVQGVFTTWSPVIQAVWSYLKDFALVLWNDIQPGLATLGKAFTSATGPGLNVKSVMAQVVNIGQSLYPVIDALGGGFNILAGFIAASLPYVGDFLNVIGFVKDRVVDVALAIKEQGPAIQALETVFASIAAAITGKLIVAFAQSIPALATQAIGWITDAAAATGAAIAEAAAVLPIIAVGLAIGGLIIGIKALIDHWSQVSAFFDNFKQALGGVKDQIGATIGGIASAVQGGLGAVRDWFNAWKVPIVAVAGLLAAVFGPALVQSGIQAVTAGGQIATSFMANLIATGTQAVVQGAKLLASFVASMATSGAQAVASGAQIAATFVVTLIKTGVQAIATAATMTATLIPAVIAQATAMAAAAAGGIAAAIAGLIGYAAAGWAAAAATIAATWPILAVIAGLALLVVGIKLAIDHWGQITEVLGHFKDVLGAVAGDIGSFVGSALGKIGEFAGHAIDLFLNIEVRWPLAIAGAVLGMLGHLKDLAVQGIATIVGFVTDVIGPQGIGGLPQKFISIAGQMLQGFIQGILQGTANVLGSVRNFASNVVNSLKSFLGIHSPSTLFAGIGSDSASGYAQGISSGKGKAVSAAQGVAKAAANSMDSQANRDAAYAAGEALIQSLADGTYAQNVALNIDMAAEKSSSGKGANTKHYAAGGIIPEMVVGRGVRSGALYTFAENGPEAVVPNLYGGSGGASSSSGGSAGGSAGMTQNITVVLDERVLTRAVLRGMPREARIATGMKL